MTATKDDFYHVGLTDDEVRKSRTEHGVNLLTPPKRPSLWKLYLEKFEDPVVRVLLVAAFFSLIISMVENEYAETIGIIAAILLATGIGFFFEYDANKKFDLLNAVNEETLVKVIRNGRVQEIPRKEVVVGDIIILETGEEIPADGELLEAISLQVNESMRSKSYNAFSSIDYPSLAVIQDMNIMRYIPMLPYEEEVRFYEKLDENVFLMKLIPGIRPKVLKSIFENYDCIIVESFGVGGIPQSIAEEFYRL